MDCTLCWAVEGLSLSALKVYPTWSPTCNQCKPYKSLESVLRNSPCYILIFLSPFVRLWRLLVFTAWLLRIVPNIINTRLIYYYFTANNGWFWVKNFFSVFLLSFFFLNKIDPQKCWIHTNCWPPKIVDPKNVWLRKMLTTFLLTPPPGDPFFKNIFYLIE
jgi:hypothetical protein